jgi:hypothetical protein
MLRLILALVVGANVACFAWMQGWLVPVFPPPHAGEREPERLAAQLRPESVVLLPGPAASAAIVAARAAALACLQAGPFSEAEAAAAEALLTAARLPPGSWQREALPAPPLWLLVASRPANPAAAQARIDELQRLQVEFEAAPDPAVAANLLVLSRHASREAAEAALTRATAVPLRGLKVVSLPPPAARYGLRVPAADPDQQDRIRALPAAPLAGGFKACAPSP